MPESYAPQQARRAPRRLPRQDDAAGDAGLARRAMPAEATPLPLRKRQAGNGDGRRPTSSSRSTSTSSGSTSRGGTSTSSSSSTSTSSSTSSSTSTSAAPAATSPSSGGGGSRSGDDASGGSANGVLTDPSSYTNTSTIVLTHLAGGGQLIYTMPLLIEGQEVNVQVDTGSSDLWLADGACRSDACQGTSSSSVQLFDSRNAPNLNIRFNIQYVQGAAQGSIVTSTVYIPGTPLALVRQAYGAANNVINEPLDAGNFTGIVGMGLPIASQLQTLLYDNTGNTNPGNDVSDASSTGSLLAGIWDGRPLGARYIGLGLQRLPSEGGKGDSTLTISSLDPAYAANLSELTFQKVPATASDASSGSGDDSSDSDTGPLPPGHWRTYLTQMTIDVGGNSVPLSLGGSAFGTQYPLATFSSGTPFSLAPSGVLNQVYGAYGYQPGSDGGYYVPCDLMMNFTLYLGSTSLQVPIHPLDASIHQTSGDPNYCFGGFQAIDTGAVSGVSKLGADFVIGAPFMRSIFTVFSCDDLVRKPTSDTSDNCNPQVGVKPLVTDLAAARQQFYEVRVLKQSLGADPVNKTAMQTGLTGGIKALIGVLCGIAAIAAIMVFVVFLLKRQRKRRHAQAIASGIEKDGGSDAESLDDAAVWSDAQLAKAREVHRMHGVFDEDDLRVEGEGGALAADQRPEFGGVSSHGDAGDLLGGASSVGAHSGGGSTPYQDAKRIKQAYLKRHPSFELKSRNEQALILSNLSQQHEGGDADADEDLRIGPNGLRSMATSAEAPVTAAAAGAGAAALAAGSQSPKPEHPLAESNSNYAQSSHRTNPSAGSSAHLLSDVNTPQVKVTGPDSPASSQKIPLPAAQPMEAPRKAPSPPAAAAPALAAAPAPAPPQKTEPAVPKSSPPSASPPPASAAAAAAAPVAAAAAATSKAPTSPVSKGPSPPSAPTSPTGQAPASVLPSNYVPATRAPSVTSRTAPVSPLVPSSRSGAGAQRAVPVMADTIPYSDFYPPIAPAGAGATGSFHIKSPSQMRDSDSRFPAETTSLLSSQRSFTSSAPSWSGLNTTGPLQMSGAYPVPHQNLNYGFLAPAADVRMQPHFHQGVTPGSSPQRSTEDLFERE